MFKIRRFSPSNNLKQINFATMPDYQKLKNKVNARLKKSNYTDSISE